jgi:hypothetical protein
MITRNNPNDKSLIKDKLKRIVLYLVVGAVLVVTGSLVYNCYTVSTVGQAQTTKKEKEVQIVTKEFEKIVGEKVEKTKETTTTQNPEKKPTGFQEVAVALLGGKTISSVVFKHFLAYLGIAILYLLIKGRSVKVGPSGVEFGSGMNETEQIVKELENQSIKLELLSFWSDETIQESFYTNVADKSFSGFMTAMLDKIKEYYATEWGLQFGFTIYSMQEFNTSDLPRIVKKSAVAVEAGKPGLPINKESNLPYHRNYLICKILEVDPSNASNTTEHMIVLSSFNSSFGNDDGKVVSRVCAIANGGYKKFSSAQFTYSLLVQCHDLTVEKQNLETLVQQLQQQLQQSQP